jgi:hypothetical protein
MDLLTSAELHLHNDFTSNKTATGNRVNAGITDVTIQMMTLSRSILAYMLTNVSNRRQGRGTSSVMVENSMMAITNA